MPRRHRFSVQASIEIDDDDRQVRVAVSTVRGLGQSWFHEQLRKITNYHFPSSQQVRPTNKQPRFFRRLFEVKVIDMPLPCGKALAYYLAQDPPGGKGDELQLINQCETGWNCIDG